MSAPEDASTLARALEGLPHDRDGPVFAEPWQAQAFAMAVELHRRGLFSWKEWADALGAEIARSGSSGRGEDYYLHWLAALERLVTTRSGIDAHQLGERKDAWDRAARATPHGEPIELDRTNK